MQRYRSNRSPQCCYTVSCHHYLKKNVLLVCRHTYRVTVIQRLRHIARRRGTASCQPRRRVCNVRFGKTPALRFSTTASYRKKHLYNTKWENYTINSNPPKTQKRYFICRRREPKTCHHCKYSREGIYEW